MDTFIPSKEVNYFALFMDFFQLFGILLILQRHFIRARARREEFERELINDMRNSHRKDNVRPDLKTNFFDNQADNMRLDQDAMIATFRSVNERYVVIHRDESSRMHCTICMMDYTNYDSLVVLKCLHVFHIECMVVWIQQK